MKLPLRTLFCLTAMAVAAGHAGAAGSGNDAAPARVLSESLKVEIRQGRVLLHLTLHNHSAHMIRVAKEFATEAELERGLFEVQDSDSGAAIPYTGMLVKRGPPTMRDYVPIKPHGRRSNTIEISKSYQFQPGHSYILRHRPSYLAADGGHPDQPLVIDTVTVQFIR
jgi:hypothetical protein